MLVITKARDNRLIKLTRELALYLMMKKRPGQARGLTVYVFAYSESVISLTNGRIAMLITNCVTRGASMLKGSSETTQSYLFPSPIAELRVVRQLRPLLHFRLDTRLMTK